MFYIIDFLCLYYSKSNSDVSVYYKTDEKSMDLIPLYWKFVKSNSYVLYYPKSNSYVLYYKSDEKSEDLIHHWWKFVKI